MASSFHVLFAHVALASSVCLLSSSAYRLRDLVEVEPATEAHPHGLLHKTVCKMNLDAVYLEGAACPPDAGGDRCGCHLGCKCTLGQSCYTNGWIHDLDEHTKRVGHCNFALWLLAVFVVILVVSLGVFCKMCFFSSS
eukprot:TRINITY_DN31822_c0_g1_i1.p1 TRINITY_DN31822_c0_g1~~TRINITY_DN31822_c0_g1_i1.p1  ORF type:complete len:138 (+),score=9.37 TRINITY_DN31822_c0_g1_i1:46-459(+)